MRITYLGTGGGGGIPEMFCDCRICENARIKQGYELRARAMALINDDLCIDLPCDARSSALTWGIDAKNIRYLLVTHDHYDHFLPENLISRPEEARPVELFISRASGKAITKKCEGFQNSSPQKDLRPVCCPTINFVKSCVPFVCGPYEVIPLQANHDPKAECLNYAIFSQGRGILWLHDTGPLHEETYRYLGDQRLRFQFVSMDCALPRGSRADDGHMDILRCTETVERLRKLGCIGETTPVYLSHISHLVGCTHREMESEARMFGFQVAFDGAAIMI